MEYTHGWNLGWNHGWNHDFIRTLITTANLRLQIGITPGSSQSVVILGVLNSGADSGSDGAFQVSAALPGSPSPATVGINPTL